ncbi:L-type lectin-domain containing receptor kinase SIT2-like [Typha latifolia]|uniref:L-type lectin-domain containing receptor kinase SIT2-like n=1 Tax=Typha latifolia TaxID=4733 RepID=UPI003C3017A6
MVFACVSLLYLLLVASSAKSLTTDEFTFNGFRNVTNLSLDGSALVTLEGVLQLTNSTRRVMGHAFFSSPVLMLKKLDNTSRALSFSTAFVFDIVPDGNAGGQGFVFAVSRAKILPGVKPGPFLGILGPQNNGNFSNHVFAVEFDTVQEATMFLDIDDNHVGVDINSLISNISRSAVYYADDSKKVDLKMESGEPIQAWIDYNGTTTVLNVTIAPLSLPKPRRPLISKVIDLSPIFEEYMYVGFSSATGKAASSHFISGWSFKSNGIAQPLDLSQLPNFPRAPRGPSTSKTVGVKIGVASSVGTFVLITMVIFASWYIWEQAKLAETIEDWELDHPHRFAYKDLYKATKGFKDTELLGVGGFGHVYKGVLRRTGQVVAIKRVSNGSRQGMKEFVTEVASLGKVRHRHLVELKGWCKRNHDLLLVYEFMPNGSLDKLLFDGNTNALPWEQRFKILKAIASGVLYLHEEWEQVIVHRDIKAGNILLDSDMNAKLSDFGLAQLHERGTNPHTTRVVGTLGYMSPELSQTGRATTSSDVFAFGALLLEVACGRRPIEPSEEPNLVNWVNECRMKGELLRVVDPRLGKCYAEEQMEMVLKLGLVCCQSIPEVRPSMRQVMQYLNGDYFLAEDKALLFSEVDTMDFFASRMSYPSSYGTMTTGSLKGGR